jgi:hypothetical protein
MDQESPPSREQWAGLSLERQAMLWGLAIVLLAAILYFLSPILAPFVAGTAVGYLLDPVADRLQRAGFSRLGAALLLLVLFILVMATALLLIAPVLSRQLAGFLTSLPGYLATLQGLLSDLSEKLTGDYVNGLLQKIGLGGAGSSFDAQKYLNDLVAEGASLVGDFLKSLLTRGAALLNVVSLIFVTPVVAFYILLDWDQMIAECDKLVPPRHRKDVRALARDVDRALAGFLRVVCARPVADWLEFRLPDRDFRWRSELHTLCRLDHGFCLVDHRGAGAGVAKLAVARGRDRGGEHGTVSRRQRPLAASGRGVGWPTSGLADVCAVRLRLAFRLYGSHRRRAGGGRRRRRPALHRAPLPRERDLSSAAFRDVSDGRFRRGAAGSEL